jgi:hypothetical protein
MPTITRIWLQSVHVPHSQTLHFAHGGVVMRFL